MLFSILVFNCYVFELLKSGISLCITLLEDYGLVLVVVVLIPPQIMCLKHVFWPKLRLVIQEPE